MYFNFNFIHTRVFCESHGFRTQMLGFAWAYDLIPTRVSIENNQSFYWSFERGRNTENRERTVLFFFFFFDNLILRAISNHLIVKHARNQFIGENYRTEPTKNLHTTCWRSGPNLHNVTVLLRDIFQASFTAKKRTFGPDLRWSVRSTASQGVVKTPLRLTNLFSGPLATEFCEPTGEKPGKKPMENENGVRRASSNSSNDVKNEHFILQKFYRVTL